MKRFFLVLTVLSVFIISGVRAQEMIAGDKLLSVGLGFIPGIGINASYDYGLIEDWGPGIFTVGGFVGLQSWGTSQTGLGNYRANIFAFAARATYRYDIDESLEIYGTFMLGPYFVNDSYKTFQNNHSGPFFGIGFGGRYHLSGNISAFAEIGYNISALSIGLSIAL